MSRRLYIALGFLFLGLAIIGVVLPVMPATPFLLIAAWFFAQSSEKWHTWLLNSKLFGPMIQNWENNRCISLRTKFVALASMIVVGGASVVFAIQVFEYRVAAVALMSVGTIVVLNLKTCPAG
ncbi:MAG: YbaN family protein [bacterium]